MNNNSTAKAVANNTFYQLAGKIISMSITILATVIIARLYSREGYGEFNLMQGIPALFFIVADFGINAIAARELSKNYEKAEEYLGNILLMRLCLSVILMVVAALTISFFPYSSSLKLGIYLSLFLILTQAMYATTNIIFQVKLRYDYSALGYVSGSIVILLLVLMFSYLRLNIMWVNFSYVIGGVITFLINFYFISRKIGLNIKLKFDPVVWRYFLVQSLPLGLMFVFSQINFKADSILLSLLEVPDFLTFSKTEAVAVYGLAFKVFEVGLVVPTFFMNAAYPILVKHQLEGAQKLRKTFLRSGAVLLGAGLIASIAGIVLAPLIVNIIGGPEFESSAGVLRILLAGIPIFYISQPVSWLIVTLENQKYLPHIYLIGALFNVIGNYIFIPIYSFYASAILTWTSELIILTLLVVLAIRSWRKVYA